MITEAETNKKPRYTCPEGHYVPYERWNVGEDYSENLRNQNGEPVFEIGLICNECKRAYGLSKLIEVRE